MANSPQEEFVHPVIEAMNNAYSLIDRDKQQKIKNALDQKDADLRQAQLDEVKRQHDQEQKNADNQFSINHALLEIHQRQASFDRAKSLQDLIAGGATPQSDVTSIPTAPPGSGVPTLDVPNPNSAHLSMLPDEHFNPNEFKTQDQLRQGQIDYNDKLTAGQIIAQQTALQPFKDAERKQAVQDRIAELAATGVNTERVARINHQNDLDKIMLQGQFQLAAARIAHQQGQAENGPLIENALNGIMNGQTAYSTLPKDIKEGVASLAGTKGWQLPTDRKAYGDKLDTVSGIQNLMDQYRDLAKNYSRDSSGTGLPGTLGVLTGSPNIPFSDMKSKIDALKANGGSLASFFDKQNRKSDAEILRQVSGLFDPRSTVKQNLDKIEQHAEQINTAIKGTFAGMKPDQINYIMSNRGITDFGGFESPKETPDWLKIAPKTNPNGKILDEQKSIELGHPAYK